MRTVDKKHNAFVQHRTELVLPAGLTDQEAEQVIAFCAEYLDDVIQGHESMVTERVVAKGKVEHLPFIDAQIIVPGWEAVSSYRVYVVSVFS